MKLQHLLSIFAPPPSLLGGAVVTGYHGAQTPIRRRAYGAAERGGGRRCSWRTTAPASKLAGGIRHTQKFQS